MKLVKMPESDVQSNLFQLVYDSLHDILIPHRITKKQNLI